MMRHKSQPRPVLSGQFYGDEAGISFLLRMPDDHHVIEVIMSIVCRTVMMLRAVKASDRILRELDEV